MSNFNIDWVKENFSTDVCIFYIGAAGLNEVISIRKHLPESKLYAFECSTHWISRFPIFEIAKSNNINYYQTAVSDVVGEIEYYPCLELNNNEWPVSSSIFEPTERLNNFKFDNPIVVNSITLEHFCEEHKIYPDFVHIDVQGAEYKVFSKISKVLPKAIWAEICEFENYNTGTTYNEFRKLMDQLGYEFFHKDGPDELFKLKTFSCSSYQTK